MYLFTGTAQRATVSTTSNTAVKFLMAGTHVSHTVLNKQQPSNLITTSTSKHKYSSGKVSLYTNIYIYINKTKQMYLKHK